MIIDHTTTRTIRTIAAGAAGLPGVEVIDQTLLPHRYEWRRLDTLAEAAHAIRAMTIRGAPLIGATAAYGVALAMRAETSDAALASACSTLGETRPTAVNLRWALDRMQRHLAPIAPAARADAAWQEAAAIADEDAAQNRRIGEHGLIVLRTLMMAKNAVPLNVMTHCNAGALATVDHGTALAPIYALHDGRWPVHVWVSETRPRNQGLLTAWELAQHGVPHTLIADNAAGLLLGSGRVDAVIVGADRIAANGDVANKIGTYLKALACADHRIPFYVAAPLTTIDWSCADGAAIEIEERSGDELRWVTGIGGDGGDGGIGALRQVPAGEPVFNPAFDVTPARLVTGIISERGVCPASREGLAGLYPEYTP